MRCNSNFHFVGLFAFVVWGIWASSIQISDAAYTGRSLLQTLKSCPVDFQSQNYTIITSQCKGPSYPVKPCCTAFKQFACQFRDEINDVSNNCANTMFSYITINGNYPPALFASECKEGKEGLDCFNVTTPASAADSAAANGVGGGRGQFQIFGLIACVVGVVLLLLLL